MNQETIRRYISNFRRQITSYLKPDIGLSIDVYNCDLEGAVVVIFFLPNGLSVDKVIPENRSIAEVLHSLKQSFIQINIGIIHFKGTNIMMESSRVIIIKDISEKEWSNGQLKKDVKAIIQPPVNSPV